MRQTRIDEFLELEHHNKELEKKIEEEVAKNREKDKLMFQQAKLASLGEMLGNISHQWRQPLMEINSLFLPIEAKLSLDMPLDNQEILETIDKLNHITKYMSNTIDDFKNFFATNKEKIKFEIENLNAEYKVLISQKIKDLTNTTNEYQREMSENTYKELEKDKTNRIEQLQKLLEQQQEDLETEKIKRLKTAIEYFDDILKSNEPNRYILECVIDKIWIYHDKSVKFELKPEISRLI